MTALEKAARAACDAEHRFHNGTVSGEMVWHSIGPDARAAWIESTRAALLSLRDCGPPKTGAVQPANAWAVHIDHILSEKP